MEEKYKELLEAVRQMRQAQKDYFKGRSGYLLKEAKQKEAKVDQMIKSEEPQGTLELEEE